MPLGETLGLPVREEPRVRPAVVAHGQCAVAQVNDLHRVRMTALQAERMIMVAPVRRRGGARCYLGHIRPTWYLNHDPPLSTRSLVVHPQYHFDTGNSPNGDIPEHMIRDWSQEATTTDEMWLSGSPGRVRRTSHRRIRP